MLSSFRDSPRSPVFIDASAWLAANNDRDVHHTLARSLLTQCFDEQVLIVTTNWTAYEALSMIKHRSSAQRARTLWDLISDPRAVDLVYVNEQIERAALELFFAYADKTWGVVDCASLIVMEVTGCHQAIAFDHHFVEASRQRGFQVLA